MKNSVVVGAGRTSEWSEQTGRHRGARRTERGCVEASDVNVALLHV